MDIESLRPSDTPEYMTPAWIGCISWALGTPEIVAAFRAETGHRWQPGRNGLERMIDKAAGADQHFIEAFIRWVNVNLWGPIESPPSDDAVARSVEASTD